VSIKSGMVQGFQGQYTECDPEAKEIREEKSGGVL
jgi:hypothetical protein